jgi:hypothetical protein
MSLGYSASGPDLGLDTQICVVGNGPRNFSSSRIGVLTAVLVTVFTQRAAAQQAPSRDTVTGRVTAQDSTPIPQASVRVRGEDGREQSAVTDSTGRYRIVMSSASGIYSLYVRAFGYVPVTLIAQRPSGVLLVERDIRMNPNRAMLESVKVLAVRPPEQTSAPGDRAVRWSSVLSEDLPVEPGEFGDFAAIQPGVVRRGSDISIAGQTAMQNRSTVDGASFNGGSLPSESVRSYGVVTNTYDVSHGKFSGGQLAATTISGTNLWGGGARMRLDESSGNDIALSQNGAFNQRRLTLSSGGGGPLIKDRLFIYSALDVSHPHSSPSRLALLDSAALQRLKISPDSASRFLAIARGFGLFPPADGILQVPESDLTVLLTRVDYALSDHQTLTARLDSRASTNSGLGSSPLSLSRSANEQRSNDVGVFAQLTSFAGNWANELRLSESSGATHGNIEFPLPNAQVQVTSVLSNRTFGSSVFGFGGTADFPEDNRYMLEAADDFEKKTLGGEHFVKAGFLAQQEGVTALRGGNRFGAFTFNSLADLESGRPASYTRNFRSASVPASRQYGALYIGDIWTRSDRLRLTYGLRLDGTRYGDRPAIAPGADTVIGTGGFGVPAELSLTPRFGFRYDAPGPGHWTLDGGVGGFYGGGSLASLAPLWGQTGVPDSSIVCVGPAAPRPDWTSFIADPGAIPSKCAGGATMFSSGAPSITLFGAHFGAPQTWRASLGLGGNLTPLWGIETDALFVHGTHLPSAVDRNLTSMPKFALGDEEDRPVYVPLAFIDPATGGIAQSASRIDGSFGAVTELGSAGKSWTEQFTVGVDGPVGRIKLLSIYYTFTRSRILLGGTPAAGVSEQTTSGDPSRLEWTDGSFTPHHIFQIISTAYLTQALRISVIGRFSSGLPFTPLVSGDINGDGFQNDRAFVFGPRMTNDTAITNGMSRLRETGPTSVGQCLGREAGRIAQPGSCRTSWSSSLDLSASLLTLGTANARRLTLMFTASNVTAGVDYLLHGRNNLHGWGQFPQPDPTLLVVRGFDPVAQTFHYSVNPQFGQPLGGGILRTAFRIALQARITLGADPQYQPLMRAITAGFGSSEATIRRQLATKLNNVPALILQLAAADTGALGLALKQRADLQGVADSLTPKFQAAIDSLTIELMQMGPVTAPRRALLQQRSEYARSLVEAGLARTREIVTPSQWSKLPAWLVRPPELEQLERPELEGSLPPPM